MNRATMLSLFPAMAAALLSGGATPARAGILPSDGVYGGRTYNQWQTLWWQRLLSIPVVNDQHPVINGGAFPGADGVEFLTGVGGGVVIDITISDNTALFLPVFNIESSVFEPAPFHGDDEASLRANSNGLLDQAYDLFASLDGAPVDLSSFRFDSPLFQWGPLPQDNLFQYFGMDAPAGTTSLAVDAGYYLLVTPLSKGLHTLHFGGKLDAIGAAIDTTYRVNVVPEPGGGVLLAAGAAASLVFARRRRTRSSSSVGG